MSVNPIISDTLISNDTMYIMHDYSQKSLIELTNNANNLYQGFYSNFLVLGSISFAIVAIIVPVLIGIYNRGSVRKLKKEVKKTKNELEESKIKFEYLTNKIEGNILLIFAKLTTNEFNFESLMIVITIQIKFLQSNHTRLEDVNNLIFKNIEKFKKENNLNDNDLKSLTENIKELKKIKYKNLPKKNKLIAKELISKLEEFERYLNNIINVKE